MYAKVYHALYTISRKINTAEHHSYCSAVDIEIIVLCYSAY